MKPGDPCCEGWLQRNWRPLMILAFVTMVFARWFGWPVTHLSESEKTEILSIIKTGLGLYVGGRSIEKITERIKGR